MNQELMFATGNVVASTPQDFFDDMNYEFGPFDVDVCALPENAKCKHYLSPEMDGLSWDWRGMCWMNPPYGREISKWVEKASKSASESYETTVVCLLPARTDTRWWHEYIWDEKLHRPRRGVEIRYVRGRLKFGGSKNGAPFPSAVVIFHGTSK